MRIKGEKSVRGDPMKFTTIPPGYVAICKDGIGVVKLIELETNTQTETTSTTNTSKKPHYCEFCNENFKNEWALRVHMQFCKNNPNRRKVGLKKTLKEEPLTKDIIEPENVEEKDLQNISPPSNTDGTDNL